jgi:prefoldin alpha subunit
LSSSPRGEEELQQLLAAYQQYQAQAEVIVRQIGLTQMTMEGLDRALRAVETMQQAEEGQEMLVPIGSGSFIHARLASKESVVLNVGASVNIEKSPAEALETLKSRKEEVSAGAKELNDVLAKIDHEMKTIQGVLSQYEQAMGQRGEEVV